MRDKRERVVDAGKEEEVAHIVFSVREYREGGARSACVAALCVNCLLENCVCVCVCVTFRVAGCVLDQNA